MFRDVHPDDEVLRNATFYFILFIYHDYSPQLHLASKFAASSSIFQCRECRIHFLFVLLFVLLFDELDVGPASFIFTKFLVHDLVQIGILGAVSVANFFFVPKFECRDERFLVDFILFGSCLNNLKFDERSDRILTFLVLGCRFANRGTIFNCLTPKPVRPWVSALSATMESDPSNLSPGTVQHGWRNLGPLGQAGGPHSRKTECT